MKNLLNLGKVLNKAEQKAVFGGNPPERLKHVDHEDGCTYEHLDLCLDGTPCTPGDGCGGSGCGHWFMVC